MDKVFLGREGVVLDHEGQGQGGGHGPPPAPYLNPWHCAQCQPMDIMAGIFQSCMVPCAWDTICHQVELEWFETMNLSDSELVTTPCTGTGSLLMLDMHGWVGLHRAGNSGPFPSSKMKLSALTALALPLHLLSEAGVWVSGC